MFTHPNLIDLPQAELGDQSFRADPRQTLWLLLVGSGMLLAGAVSSYFWLQGQLQGRMGALPFLLLPCGAVILGWQIWKLFAPLHVTTSIAGLTVRGTFCPWEDVTAVREQLNLLSRLNSLTVSLTRADGSRLHFSAATLDRLPDLLVVIHHHTAQRLADAARQALAAGEAVSFGPIHLHPEGLDLKNAFLPWDRLDRVWPDEAGDVGVWTTTGECALDVPTGQVDNLRLLLQLADESVQSAV